MCKRSRRGVWLLIGLLLMLAACENVAEAPSPDSSEPARSIQGEIGIGMATRTIKPIVSYTPWYTATPIPSITLTPSDTPTVTPTLAPATATPTVSPTPTPTAEGIIRSTQRVNLREGPGTEFPSAFSINPGTSLGVIGIDTDGSGRSWYQVVYTDEDGEAHELWVLANLVETDYQEVAAAPSATAGTPQPSGSPGPATVTRTPGPTPVPNSVKVLAYCRQKNVRPPRVTTNDEVYVEWSWYVAQPDQMDQHLQNANYAVRLDGRLLENWSQYATEMKLEQGVWIIYWYYPVGRLSAGLHEVTFELTWDAAITDGYKDFGPGTPNETDEGNCIFEVVEP